MYKVRAPLKCSANLILFFTDKKIYIQKLSWNLVKTCLHASLSHFMYILDNLKWVIIFKKKNDSLMSLYLKCSFNFNLSDLLSNLIYNRSLLRSLTNLWIRYFLSTIFLYFSRWTCVIVKYLISYIYFCLSKWYILIILSVCLLNMRAWMNCVSRINMKHIWDLALTPGIKSNMLGDS